jgi:hypothetical protein
LPAFLRTLAAEQPATPDEAASAAPELTPTAEILELDEDAISAWAGRAVFRQALDDLAGGPELLVEEGERMLLLSFPQRNITLRWPAGAGLNGLICSAKCNGPCRHAAAALLAFLIRHGRAAPALERVLAVPGGAPRSRTEVLTDVDATLSELVAIGFVRLSRANEERLRTLAVSAHGVDLPRLERALRALSDQVAWHVGRDVRAAGSELLSSAARTAALVQALQQATEPLPATLVGEHRSRYYDVGSLELVGAGAQQWRTRSGYAGLTVYFWDLAAQRWASWSDSRPLFNQRQPFEPIQRYRRERTWADAPAPAELCRSRLRLLRARRNREGRLSNAGSSQAMLFGAADLENIDFGTARFDDWAELRRKLAAGYNSGLAPGRPLDRLVLICPARWGAPDYNEQRQTLLRPVFDAQERGLLLALPHQADWAFATDTLEHWGPAEKQTWGILGFGSLTAAGIELLPVALLNRESGAALHCLTLDNATGSAGGSPANTPERTEPDPSTDDDPPDEETSTASSGSNLELLLDAALLQLTHLAEQGGAGQPSAEEQLQELAARMEQLGLRIVAEALQGLAGELAAGRRRLAPDERARARLILRAAYLLNLAREQIAPARALMMEV